MTADSDKIQNPAPASVPVDVSTSVPTPMISRRMLLRGASAAVPTILTLQSGAALAASSNLIGTVQNAGNAIGEGGNVQCLDMASAVDGSPTKLDLGPNPDLHVQYIPQRDYYRTAQDAAAGKLENRVPIEYICEYGNGGNDDLPYWYKPSTGQSRQLLSVTPAEQPLKAGFLVSSTALTSFASAIHYKTYF